MSYTLPEPYDSVFWEGKIVDVFRPEQMQAAFDAGRASRDGEVEALKQELNQVNIERLKWKEWTEKAEKEVEALRAERDCAVAMLAGWCVDVDMGGSGWDYWDEHYKTAMYRLNPIRKLLDQAINAARKEKQDE